MDPELPEIDGKIRLFKHQVKAIDELHNGSILWSRPGNGKSLTAIAYYYSKVCKGVYHDLSSMREPRDLYIITTAKKRDTGDWERDAGNFCITGDRDASVAGVKLTVDSWNNIGKYEEVEDAFFIFDEQRIVGSGAWAKHFIKIAKRNQWILLTATPGDTWLDYIPVFIANGFYKNRTQFKREHVVYNTFSKFPKVDRYINVGHLVRLRNSILVHMPYPKHTIRHEKYVVVDHDKELFRKAVEERWHVFENRPLKDVGELFRVMRKIVNSDVSRLTTIQRLMSDHPRLIVFYNFDYELEMLRTLGEFSDPFTGTRSSASEPSTGDSTIHTRLRSSSEKRQPEASKSSSETDTDRASLMSGSDQTQSLEKPAPTVSVPVVKPAWSGRGIESMRLSTSATSEKAQDFYPTQEPSYRDTNVSSHPEPAEPSNVRELGSVAIAEWNGHKHQPIPETDRWVYLVQYVAGAEGWNCVETDAMCFFSLTYSFKNYDQAKGRIDRLDTPFNHLFYYTLISKSMIDGAIMKSLKQKKNFNESDYGSRF